MFAGTVGAGILGYVFQVLMGRMLSTADYGLFNALMALFAVFSAPLATLLMIVARKVSEYRARNDYGSIRQFYFSITLWTTLVSALILGVTLLAAPDLQAYLKSPAQGPIYLFAALLFFSFFPILNDGFLQGLQSFSWLSASTALRTFLRIVFCAGLIMSGLGVSGAVAGAMLSSIAGWAVTYWPLRRRLGHGGSPRFLRDHLRFRQSAPVFVANIAFAVMTQFDMVLVNHYFPAHEAGLYAAASILGKAVMYLPSGIAMALFPMVAEDHARDKSSAHLLVQAVGLTSVLCLAGAMFYFVLGQPLIEVLYGEAYRAAGEVLRYFGFAILPMALVMVAEYFLIAKGRVLFAYLFMFTAPLEVFAIALWHGSLQTIVAIVGASGATLAAIGYAMLWQSYRAARK